MYYNKRCKTFCIVINNVLIIVINIQNTTIFEPVILTGFYTTVVNIEATKCSVTFPLIHIEKIF